MQLKGKVQRKSIPGFKQSNLKTEGPQTEDMDLEPLGNELDVQHLGIVKNHNESKNSLQNLTASNLLRLQHTIGNKAVSRIIAKEIDARKAQSGLNQTQKPGPGAGKITSLQRKIADK